MHEIPFNRIRLVAPPAIFRGEPGWHWRSEVPDYINLWIALEGRGELTRDEERLPIQAGSIFALLPGQVIDAIQYPESRIRNFAAHIRLYSGRSAVAWSTDWPSFAVVENTGRIEMYARSAVEWGRYTDKLGALQTEGLIFQLVAELLRAGQSGPMRPVDSRIQAVMQRLEEDPSHWLNLDDMAAQAGLSRAQFTRRFREAYGISPGRFAMQARIRRAHELLRNSSLRVGEVATALGYQDVYFFSRQYRQHTGHPPGHDRCNTRKQAGMPVLPSLLSQSSHRN